MLSSDSLSYSSGWICKVAAEDYLEGFSYKYDKKMMSIESFLNRINITIHKDSQGRATMAFA